MNNKNNGKEFDVLIYDNLTGGFEVWADDGMKEIIKNVDGVVWVGQDNTQYTIHLDPRYNKDYLYKEIEAVIKCAE